MNKPSLHNAAATNFAFGRFASLGPNLHAAPPHTYRRRAPGTSLANAATVILSPSARLQTRTLIRHSNSMKAHGESVWECAAAPSSTAFEQMTPEGMRPMMPNTTQRRHRLLIADDEPEIRDVLRDLLSDEYDCATVSSAEDALALLSVEQFDLIISDITMRGMSGLDMVPYVLASAPETIIIMISGAQTIENAIQALRVGAFDYLTKPFDLRQVSMIVRRALEHQNLVAEHRRYKSYLEEQVSERTAQLARALDSLEGAYRSTLKALAAALETRDHETRGHSERVISYSLRLGQELGLDKEQLRSLEFGSLLHDIGKIGIPDAILRKPARLTEQEWTQMRQHPLLGQQILCGIEFLEGAARVVAQHHEKWDGSGYPLGLHGEQIDFNARIFAVADTFDAITSNRVYRHGSSYEMAAAELDRYAGTQFDPQVVKAFHRIPRHEWELLRHHIEDRAQTCTGKAIGPALALSSRFNALSI